ncbi:MAG: PPK2 family polyphosphate kinase [Lautropia sp.]
MARKDGGGRDGGRQAPKAGKSGRNAKTGKAFEDGKPVKGGRSVRLIAGGRSGSGARSGTPAKPPKGAGPKLRGVTSRNGWFELDDSAAANVLTQLSGEHTPGFDGTREEAEIATERLRQRLVDLQQRLYAEDKHKVLVVLQAMDTGGKDGTIQKVFSGVNPLGVAVARFERPTPVELAHDYLWRVHQVVPQKGQIVIFNRSHYEDVLVVRVNSLVPEAVWRKRYGHLCDFERLLADEGTTILKFYLHIDAAEQKSRLQARLDEPDKRWKFDPGDLEQRRHWLEYMAAFRDAIVETHRPEAPWFVVPANKKWFRDYAILSILVSALERLDPRYPEPTFDPAGIVIT